MALCYFYFSDLLLEHPWTTIIHREYCLDIIFLLCSAPSHRRQTWTSWETMQRSVLALIVAYSHLIVHVACVRCQLVLQHWLDAKEGRQPTNVSDGFQLAWLLNASPGTILTFLFQISCLFLKCVHLFPDSSNCHPSYPYKAKAR